MGKLVKNHLARLIALVAATYQLWGGFMGCFWPKIFWDWQTKLLDPFVKPVPTLQIINMTLAIVALSFEWPVSFLAKWKLHGSIEFRLFLLPTAALFAALQYQCTNPAIYYCFAIALYFWAYAEGEVICDKPWQLPKKRKTAAKV